MDTKLEEIKEFLQDRDGREVEVTVDEHDDCLFRTDNGEEYLVLDDIEADDRHHQSIENDIDELGIANAFADAFKTYIAEYAVDKNKIEEFLDEDADYKAYQTSIDDLKDYLESYNIIEDGVENEIIEENEDTFREELYDEIHKEYTPDFDGLVQWFGTKKEAWDWVRNEGAYDLDDIVNEIKQWDGRGPALSPYDGVEEETTHYYVYRVN